MIVQNINKSLRPKGKFVKSTYYGDETPRSYNERVTLTAFVSVVDLVLDTLTICVIFLFEALDKLGISLYSSYPARSGETTITITSSAK